MDTFRIDYEKIDVEAIMAHIRHRVREKTGVVYSAEELERLGGLELPSPIPPEPEDPDRDRLPLPPLPPPLDPRERINKRASETRLDDIKDTDFVTEALRCVGEWNISIGIEDLYKTDKRGIKGRLISLLRSINRKLFKSVMNIDVLFPQLHRQAVLNQTFVVILHTIVQELSNIAGDMRRFRGDLSTLSDDLRRAAETLDHDLKQVQVELQRDIVTDKNDSNRGINQVRNDFDKLQYKLDTLRGLVEGQKHILEYLQARQRALEQLAVLKEEAGAAGAPAGKTTEIPRGRYKPSREGERR